MTSGVYQKRRLDRLGGMRITACNVWVAPEAQVVPQTINFLKYLGLIGTLALIVCLGPGGCAAHRKHTSQVVGQEAYLAPMFDASVQRRLQCATFIGSTFCNQYQSLVRSAPTTHDEMMQEMDHSGH